MVALGFTVLTFLHLIVLILSIKVLYKYESTLQQLCVFGSFHLTSYSAIRLWTLIMSFVLSFSLFLLNLGYIVAPPVNISLQYLMSIDLASAVLNINILLMMLLEKRKGNLC
jgi:hypothetical protein